MNGGQDQSRSLEDRKHWVSGSLSPTGGDHQLWMEVCRCMVGNEAGQADGTSHLMVPQER